MEFGEALTRWTVRLAVACYFGRLLIDVAAPSHERWQRVSRRLWTIGCGAYLMHVAAAFHFFHGWSHAAAWRSTARQTGELFGLDWGGGLYVNYLFTAVWIGDASAWWFLGLSYPRRWRRVYRALQGFFAFIAFNATVVFGPHFWKWAAAAGIIALGAASAARYFRMRSVARKECGR